MAKQTNAQKQKELLRTSRPERMDRMDRYRAFFLGQLELNPTEQEQLRKYRIAFAQYMQDNSKHYTIVFLTQELKLSDSQCYAILNDALKLFGDSLKADKAGERMASREHYIRLAKAAETSGDYETARKCRVQADKIIGLYEPDEAKIPLKMLFPATTIVFSSDPDVLRKQQQQPDEDATYELMQ